MVRNMRKWRICILTNSTRFWKKCGRVVDGNGRLFLELICRRPPAGEPDWKGECVERRRRETDRSADADDSDVGLAQTREGELSARVRAGLYCRLEADVVDSCQRLGEGLFYRRNRAAAAECARVAFALQPDDEAIIDFCAWLFSNCERHGDAAAAYERLLDHRPQWAAGHRHASGSYAAAGQLDCAMFHGLRAHELDPGSFEFAFHAGCLLQAAGRGCEAAGLFRHAGLIDPLAASVARRLSEIALVAGRLAEAADFALRELALKPQDDDSARHAAELMLRAIRYDEAVTIIEANLALHPADNLAWRILSAAEMLRGRLPEAIDAIDRALAVAPDIAEYHLHRGTLLHRQADFDTAAAAFGQAAELDPGSSDAKRSQMAVYLDAGRLRDAVTVGGELVRSAPDNEEYARALVHALNRQLDTFAGEFVVVGEGHPPRSRVPRPAPRAFDALVAQLRVVYALILRETRTRFGDSILGYGWALIEPVLHIAMLTAAFAVLMRGRPPIGTHFFIVYYTDLIRYSGANGTR